MTRVILPYVYIHVTSITYDFNLSGEIYTHDRPLKLYKYVYVLHTKYTKGVQG